MFLKSAFCLNCDLYMRTRTQSRDVLVALLFGLTFKDAQNVISPPIFHRLLRADDFFKFIVKRKRRKIDK